jgi:voltage-gated potassium channel
VTRSSLRWVLPAAALFVLLAGGGFAALETDTVSTYWEGVWWALALMTTVGFVGGSPVTPLGQALAALLMILGFLLLALTTAAVASLFVSKEEAPHEERDRAFEREALAELRSLSARLERLERRLDAETQRN